MSLTQLVHIVVLMLQGGDGSHDRNSCQPLRERGHLHPRHWRAFVNRRACAHATRCERYLTPPRDAAQKPGTWALPKLTKV